MTDTQEPIVPPEDPPGPAAHAADVGAPLGVAPNPTHRWWAIPIASVGLLGLVAMIVATFFTASRFSSVQRPYAIVPSSAEDVQSHLVLDDVETYPVDGNILFVTIRQPELSLLGWALFRNADEVSGRTYADVYGTSTPQQVQVRGRRQMFSAQQAAEFVALSKLGFPVERSPGEVVVDQIVCFKASEDGRSCVDEAPSGKVLQADDQIVSIDGHQIDTVEDLTPVLAEHKPGDLVEVEFIRAGSDVTQTGQIELIASPDDPNRTIIGFYPFDTTTISSSPFPIEFNLSGVGGPSAGLAFTLTLIDELTPGSLTGGHQVAVTGEIDVNGNVGAIGGLPQKASAVQQTGTRYFIVPAGQSEQSLAEARAIVGDDVQIITVATLDEALAALAAIGGNGDDLGQPGADWAGN